MRLFTVKSDTVISDELIADWAVTAFEGGITYWCDRAEAVERDKNGQWVNMNHQRLQEFEHDGYPVYAAPEFWENDCRGYKLYDPYEQRFCDKVLTLAGMLKALKHQPPHRKGISDNWFRKVVARLIGEDYDSEDADTLVQIAVFNEVVYG